MEESIIDLQKKEILTSTRNLGGLARYAVGSNLCIKMFMCLRFEAFVACMKMPFLWGFLFEST